jgi:crotonobetainyl-CoA:carnitine CoA-transferase CaiB-like acyl-CoA transferase
MLPPNLTRNYYEVKRLIAEGEGRELPHWYQLTAEQQRAEDLDVELFRRAILRSEEEQDLVAKFNAPAAQEAPAAEAAEPAADCGCPGCSTVRALAELMRQAKRLEVTLGWDGDRNGQGATVYAFKPMPLTAEEHADLRKRTAEAIAQWVAKNPMTGIRASRSDGFTPSWPDLERWAMRRQASVPRVFLRDL